MIHYFSVGNMNFTCKAESFVKLIVLLVNRKILLLFLPPLSDHYFFFSFFPLESCVASSIGGLTETEVMAVIFQVTNLCMKLLLHS